MEAAMNPDLIDLEIHLPYPPSVNRYWRTFRGRMILSAEGRIYRQRVEAIVRGQVEPMRGRLSVHVKAWMPDKRTRDLDNLNKAVLDALAHAGVYADDGQIDQLAVTRMGFKPPTGALVVEVSSIPTNTLFGVEA